MNSAKQKARPQLARALGLLGTTVLFISSSGCSSTYQDVTEDSTTDTGGFTGTPGGGGSNSTSGGGSKATSGGNGGADAPTAGTGGKLGTNGGLTLKGRPEYYGYVRLTHQQWANSINDIFGVDTITTDLTSTLHPDPPNGTFANNERALYVGAELWADYQRSAEQAAENIGQDSPAMNALGGLSDSKEFIEKVGRRAFRRPLRADEITAYQDLWNQGSTFYGSGDAGLDGVRIFIRALLQSAHFVYRVESTLPGTRLSGFELATKISFLLKKTTPNDQLLAAAEKGELDTDEGLETVVTDLLKDDNARQALRQFHSELYGLERYKNIEKSTDAFPRYNEGVNEVLEQADLMFFDTIVEEDGGLRDILTSPIAYVNSDIAHYYGLTSNSTELTEVTLDDTRPGYLTRVGFLTYNATLSMPDPIHRGVDINLRMLCQQLSPPPGAIPPLPPSVPNQSNRERVEAHTGSGICANCHATIINPIGFAFESFDAMGQVREMDAGEPVNTSDSYEFKDGLKSFADAPELISLMAENRQTHNCYSSKLSEYLLGRDLAQQEVDLVTAVSESSFEDDASVRQLVLATLLNPQFTHAQKGEAQ